VWGSKNSSGVDSRVSCSTACQQGGVRVIRKRYFFSTTSYLQERDQVPFPIPHFFFISIQLDPKIPPLTMHI